MADQVTGYNYFGSFVLVVGVGPMDVLFQIKNGDTVIWTGPIYRESADSDGKTRISTTLGPFDFYWGTQTQNVNDTLAALQLDLGRGPQDISMPAFRNLCYVVGYGIAFGRQVSPPTLVFEVARYPNALPISGGVNQIRLDSPGAGYRVPPTVVLTPVSGGSGAAASVLLPGGYLKQVKVTQRGYGYLTAPTVVFTGGGGTGAAATAVLLEGYVSEIRITNTGSGFTTAPTVTLTGGNPQKQALAAAQIEVLQATKILITSKGAGYVLPPLVTFVPVGLDPGTGMTATAILKHQIQEDANQVEVLFDAATNQLYGAGIPTSKLNLTSWATAAQTVQDEGAGVTLSLDEPLTLRELAGKLQPYFDGYPVWKNGLLDIVLERNLSTAGLQTLTEADMTDEPVPHNDGTDSTWNMTRVTFTDRSTDYQPGTSTYDEAAHGFVLGEVVDKNFNLPWLTEQAGAYKVAKRLGLRGSLPPVQWVLRLKPSFRTLVPGDRFFLSYAPFGGSRLMRVKDVARGGPHAPEIEVTVTQEQTRDASNDYEPAQDWFNFPSVLRTEGTKEFALPFPVARLSTLPTALKDGKQDGLLVGINRASWLQNEIEIDFGWGVAFQAYRPLAVSNSFPAWGEIIGWHRIRGDSWVLRIVMASEIDSIAFFNDVANKVDVFCAFGLRLVRTTGTLKDQHQVQASWGQMVPGGRVLAVAGNVVDFEIQDAAFGTVALAQETLSADGKFPTVEVFIGKQTDFAIVTSDAIWFDRLGHNAPRDRSGTYADSDYRRYVRALYGGDLGTRQAIAPSDYPVNFYDRDTTTMSPDGTFYREWGRRAQTTHEALDFAAGGKVVGLPNGLYQYLEDLDLALGAIQQGADLEDESAVLVQDLDETLGAMVDRKLTIYNKTTT